VTPGAVRAALLLALCLGVAGPLAAQGDESITLTPADMRATAFADLRGGNAARALALSEALLMRDARDPVALRIGSQAALQMGQSDVALRHARTL